MNAVNGLKQTEHPRYLKFNELPAGSKYEDGTIALNRHSGMLTSGHDFPGAQVC